MMTKLPKPFDFSFWVPLISGSVLTVVGVILGLWTAIHSHYDSLKQKEKADQIAERHQNLLKQNFDKSLNIIEELNKTAVDVQTLLKSSSIVIDQQNKASSMLIEQANSTSEINRSIIDSGKTIVSAINKAGENLENNITGGESYCTIQLTSYGNNKFQISGSNNFRNKIPDVRLIISNYSQIQNCRFVEEDNVIKIVQSCFKANSIEHPPITFSIGANYDLGCSNFIDTSGHLSKLGIFIITLKNIFYVQMAYQVLSPTKVLCSTKLFKKVDGDYQVVDSKFAVGLSFTETQWKALFPLPIEIFVINI